MPDWDAWRAAYPTMTFADHQAFYSETYRAYPEQRHYSAEQVALAINHAQPTTVVELGGWDGELAEEMLTQHPAIETWVNVELCGEAAATGQGRHPRYSAPSLSDWYWTRRWSADLFVASHAIEHLTATHLDQVIGATDARYLFLDAPLDDTPTRWQGFTGTHILEVGWDGVAAICNAHGYVLEYAVNHATDPSSGGAARSCLFRRDFEGGGEDHE